MTPWQFGKGIDRVIRPANFTTLMLRKVTQAILLPVLFALLTVGGKTTLCDVLSVVGLEGHHHPCEDDRSAAPLCFETHDHDHDHGHDEVPCPESCEIQLSEAPAPILLKVPALAETFSLPCLLEVLLAASRPGECLRSVEKLEPPDHAVSLIDPTFTGRFLV